MSPSSISSPFVRLFWNSLQVLEMDSYRGEIFQTDFTHAKQAEDVYEESTLIIN